MYYNPQTHRSSVTAPDDGSLMTYTPYVELQDRTRMFSDETGIERLSLVVSRLVNTPIPFYPAEWEPGRRRWAGVRPEAMWHPLMWLTDDIATRFIFDDGGIEDDDSWAMRVAFEMTARNLYDTETGMWADVLLPVGINVDSPAGIKRVQAWLDGNVDHDLDNLRLPEATFDPELLDPDWSVLATKAVIEALHIARIANDAQVLASDFEAITDLVFDGADRADSAALTRVAEMIESFFAVCAACFASISDDETGRWTQLSEWVDQHLTAFAETGSGGGNDIAAMLEFLADDRIGEGLARIDEIAADYTSHAERLAQTFTT